VTGTVTKHQNGIYKTAYTLKKAGKYNMVIQLKPKGSTNTYAIKGSPFSVTCSVTTTDPSKTTLTGAGVTAAVAGIQDKFTVTLFDSGNNQRTSGGDTLLLTISNGVTAIEYFDNKDGTYKVEYKILAAVSHTLTLIVNGVSANTFTRTIVVSPNVAVPETSSQTFVPLVTLAVPTAVTVVIRDAWNNAVTVAQNLVHVVVG
jgi:hypothetical protein